ncbi:MAG: sigma-70 family RNA polymerase sigma factor [Deltaproteobacteria bacterium]
MGKVNVGSVVIVVQQIEDLIAQVALGNRKAFSELYDLTSAKLFGVSLRVLSNQAEAEDVLQEAYIKIWQSAGKYQVNGLSPMTWLITLTRNTAIDRIRQRRQTVDINDQVDLADKRPNPEDSAVLSAERRRLEGCLSTLESDRATAVRGAYVEGYSYDELAAKFNVPLNTMRTWLRRSLLSLRECLS